MLLWFSLCLSLSASESPPSLQEFFEYQYRQQIKELERQNTELKARLLQKEQCSTALETTSTAVESRADKKRLARLKKELKNREGDLYREALSKIEIENWDEAIVLMEDFIRSFPESDLSDNALYWIAQIYLMKKENDLARTELKRLLHLYPDGDRARRARTLLKNLERNPK